MAAYAARAGLSTHVAFPSDVPEPFTHHSRALGADVHLVDGTISDAGKRLEEAMHREGLAEEVFRLSTLKEPYRLEGKKTMGYELIPPWGPGLPDVIVYPTGGGTGLVGMWKAFAEMESLGWIGKERPRMVSVQLETCAPIVEAWRRGLDCMPADLPPTVPTAACGLRVPHPFADREILQTLRESDGFAVSVTEGEILTAQGELSELEGVLAAPESAATVAAISSLIDAGILAPDTMAILFITGGSALYT
jgi:threonine synthase